MMRRILAILSFVLLAAAMAGQLGASAREPVADPAALAKSCERGSASSCVHLGILHWHGLHVARDFALALSFFEKACDSGASLGCGKAGEMIFLGQGCAKDAERGSDLMRSACASGNVWSCDAIRRHGLDG
jgi:hypothetical protein